MDLDAFFVAVERVLDSRLCGRPVVVGGRPDQRGVVAAASYEARAWGVHSAMPMAQAFRLCPDLIRVSGSHAMYSRASRAVFQQLGDYTPMVEKVSVDEAYLDLSGTSILLGDALDVADKMRKSLKERLRLDITIGLSSNRLVSKIASAFAKPQGLFEVRPGGESRFLAPLPVRALPGVGPVTTRRLQDLHVEKLGTLARIESWFLEDVFGQLGLVMQRRARGGDDTPVKPPWEVRQARSIGHQETFTQDTDDLVFLRAKIQDLLAHASSRLRQKCLLAKTVSVQVRYADFVSATRHVSLANTSDHDMEFLGPALHLLRGLTQRRTLVRLLGIRLSGLSSGFWQGGLLDNRAVRSRRLVGAVDRVRAKYGFDSVRIGETVRLMQLALHRAYINARTSSWMCRVCSYYAKLSAAYSTRWVPRT